MSGKCGFTSSGEVAEDELHGTFRQLNSPPISRRNSVDLSEATDKEDNFDQA